MLRLCLMLITLLTIRHGYAQVDTEFWFAPPEVTRGHGDRPVYLRISTLDKAAAVTVFQPGRSNLQIATANIPANTTHTIDLTGRITNLETISPATVMKTGIRITSSTPVTAYYEVGAPFNADIFTLKGRNALGNKFIIPAQNLYNNRSTYSPTPSSSFDIVATRNNTVVKVYPTKPIYGHLQESVITVKLNAGETYSFRKPTSSASDNAGGTRVESNKPIAITIKDDSVVNGSCHDLLGDQLVPVEVAGTEYVVLKGFLNTSEYLFITATEDDTEIFIGGNATPVTTSAAGAVYRHRVTAKSTYITSNKTIYVFHVTGFGCEMGMAILPSINCKGSRQIGFSRTTDEFFGLNVLVRKEGIGKFVLNGSSTLIPPSAFTAVAGTGDKWYTAQLSFNTAEIRVGQASLISNSEHSFQVGIINGNASSTCRYGYFSAFSTLFIGDDLEFCSGDVAMLDAGPDKESYLWNTGASTQTIAVTSAGEYSVRVEREECVLYDTIRVAVKTGHLDLGPDRVICEGDTAKIDGKENFSWEWSDGTENQFLQTTKAGKYWVSVFDNTGCTASDTIMVSHKALPVIDLGADIVKCAHEQVTLNAAFPGAVHRWHDGATTATRVVANAGIYSVKVTANGCSYIDSVEVAHLPQPAQDTIYGTPSVCPSVEDVDYRVDGISGSGYEWFVEGGNITSHNENAVTISWFQENAEARVKTVVTGPNGCRGDTLMYPVRVNAVLLPEIPFGPDTLCLNKALQVVYDTPPTNGSIYEWHITGGEIRSGQGSERVIINWREGINRLWISESSVTTDTFCEGLSDELVVYVFRDTTAIAMNYVSVDTSDASRIHINWDLNDTQFIRNNELYLYRRNSGSAAWEMIATLAPAKRSFEDAAKLSSPDFYEYYLSVTNACDEPVSTAIHNNMRLTGQSDTLSGLITLQWNHYIGWPQGVRYYEVWRKTDDNPAFTFLARVPSHETAFAANLAADAFQHRYLIRAIEKEGSNESWSTPLAFAFSHAVTIPNIITPNGDQYNQYFHIDKVELYHHAELTIVDRWGKTVFRAKNYQNNWDAAGLSAGVYFYVLDLKRGNKVYKGTLTIL